MNDQQLIQLKQQLEDQKAEVLKSIAIKDKNIATNSAESGELSIYDNHPADSGSELHEREKDLTLLKYAHSDLDKIEHALNMMQNGKYGVCEICSEPISMERLVAIPYTTHCVNHSTQQSKNIQPHENNNHFISEHEPNDFYSVARFGTSETPSDFYKEIDDYNEIYDHDDSD